MTAEQIETLGDFAGSSAFSDLEKTVIAFAEQFTTDASVQPAVMNKLKESLGPEQLVKLAAAVGQANWTNRFNNAFDVVLP